MDAACTIQDSIHVFSLVRKYVSRILGTYQKQMPGLFYARSYCRQVLQTGNRRKNQRKKYFLKICTKFSKETSDK